MTQKASAINIIWLAMIVIATVTAAYTGTMAEVTKASFDSAKNAVILAIGLIGPMALWLGIMKVAEAGGLMRIIARAMRPLMIRLFPDVPAEHPAMSAMIMNMAANALGLGNAATPMGIKAMQELEKLSVEKGTATNAMCLFLAINTSSVTLLPLGVITVRAAANATSPSAILIPSLIATLCSTLVAIFVSKLLSKKETLLAVDLAPHEKEDIDREISPDKEELIAPGKSGRIFIWMMIILFLGGVVYQLVQQPGSLVFSSTTFNTVSNWLIPVLISSLLIFGYFKGVKIYETVTDGAKE